MPYCRKCGKPTNEAPDGLCDNCRNAELIFGDGTFTEKPVEGSRMDGFPKALTSVIVSVVSFIIVLVIYVTVYSAAYMKLLDYTGVPLTSLLNDTEIALIVVGYVCALGGVILSVVFGAMSIAKFVDSKRKGKVKPIATLVCGIVGLAVSATTALYMFLTIILLSL